jgi:L-lactate dehydrogenase complex protein LldG
MSSRDDILRRIRAELAKGPAVAPPPVPEVWPASETVDPAALAERFACELQAVHGEVLRAATTAEAGERLCRSLSDAGWHKIGAADRLLVREIAALLPSDRIAWAEPGWRSGEMANLDVSLIGAECLLADTGTCVVACRTAPERLLCYLPPACIVVATVDQLAEHLPAAWPELARRCADPQEGGELVMITGPSRTSDIEKVLILGVHGPKRLVVVLVG